MIPGHHKRLKINLVSSSNMSTISETTTDKPVYPLHEQWTLWYGRWDAPAQVMSFTTLNDFWSLFNNIKCPTNLPPKMDYHLFKHGIEPKSEDTNNVDGGSLSVECSHHEIEKFWLHTVLATIGNNFTDQDYICGMMINVRPKFGRIQLWLKNCTDNNILKRIGTEWKQHIECHYRQQVKYTTHHDIFVKQDLRPKLVI
ncbi:MAG: eukaryotic translation initiation factor EIF4E family protein [Alphaproteobacteria bacterium]|nr:eukaryotic translation initiation factor EIF4E family protein [Alphaproteobacteria bacterium]